MNEIRRHLFWMTFFLPLGALLLAVGDLIVGVIYLSLGLADLLRAEWGLNPERYPPLFQEHPDAVWYTMYIGTAVIGGAIFIRQL